VLSNHDIDRACDRYGGPDPDTAAPLLALLLCTLRGTPFLYYGEEIGMRTVPPGSLAEVQDPVGRRFWPAYKGRDGCRRPMQWDGSANAGFTRGRPWLPAAPDVPERSVAQQQAPGSLLHCYRALLALRRSSAALAEGSLRLLDTPARVLGFARAHGTQQALVFLNLSADRMTVALDPPARGARWRVAFGTRRRPGEMVAAGACHLAGFEALLVQAG
jgi:alpha-glucosidase